MKPIPSNAASEYLRQGFVVLPQILDDEELAVLERSCDTLLAEPPDDDMGGKAHDIGKGHDRRFLRNVANRFWQIERKRLVEVDDPEAFLSAEIAGG